MGNSGKLESYGIHWFRRDLRVAANPALEWSWKEHSGRVVGIFCFDREFLSRPDFSANRFAFFLNTVCDLREELRSLGGDLLVLDSSPDEGFEKVFAALRANSRVLPSSISFNRDYEPFARVRDKRMTDIFISEWGMSVHTERDHLLIEPAELTKGEGDDGFYQVYSPFARKWFSIFGQEEIQHRIERAKRGLAYLDRRAKGEIDHQLFGLRWADVFGDLPLPEDMLEEYRQENQKRVSISIPASGSLTALKRLRDFNTRALSGYHEQRDYPDRDCTSQLAAFFKNGSLTSSLVLAELGLKSPNFKEKNGETVYLKELVWREFYYHILFHVPRVENEAFLERYKDIAWENDEQLFTAWKNGLTGYPIVDAGMRQLKSTGWMHNRVRMIVASFLTKDLLIDWRWGERYFMEQLLDGDLAPNNGGWQWAASTGCDPQPYFRIFNPLLQSKKFDPSGDYIKKYVPELRPLSGEELHQPEEMAKRVGYPEPVVDHHERKEAALALYKR